MPNWSSPLLLRSLAATGALLVLAGGGFLVANAGRSTSSQTAASEPAAGRPSSFKGASAGAFAPIVVGYRQRGQLQHTDAVASDSDYSRSDIATGVRREVRSDGTTVYSTPGPMTEHSAGPTTAGSGPARHVGPFSVAQLARCLTAVAASRPVILAEVARYLGRRAAIIVLRPVGDAFDVIVVGVACTTDDKHVIARLSIPRK